MRFFDSATGDVLRSIDGRALFGSSTLALCVLDYLAYLRPRDEPKGNKFNYRAIVDDFLVPVNGRYNSMKLYALRCALIHTYAEATAMADAGLTGYVMAHRQPWFHLAGDDSILRINADTFVADVIWGAWTFFKAVHGDAVVEARANSLVRISISAAVATERSYASMHCALAEFDLPEPELSRLRVVVTALYP